MVGIYYTVIIIRNKIYNETPDLILIKITEKRKIKHPSWTLNGGKNRIQEIMSFAMPLVSDKVGYSKFHPSVPFHISYELKTGTSSLRILLSCLFIYFDSKFLAKFSPYSTGASYTNCFIYHPKQWAVQLSPLSMGAIP